MKFRGLQAQWASSVLSQWWSVSGKPSWDAEGYQSSCTSATYPMGTECGCMHAMQWHPPLFPFPNQKTEN